MRRYYEVASDCLSTVRPSVRLSVHSWFALRIWIQYTRYNPHTQGRIQDLTQGAKIYFIK